MTEAEPMYPEALQICAERSSAMIPSPPRVTTTWACSFARGERRGRLDEQRRGLEMTGRSSEKTIGTSRSHTRTSRPLTEAWDDMTRRPRATSRRSRQWKGRWGASIGHTARIEFNYGTFLRDLRTFPRGRASRRARIRDRPRWTRSRQSPGPTEPRRRGEAL